MTETGESGRDLSDGALEARLRLMAYHLGALSKEDLIEIAVQERRHRVLDRRFFLAMLMEQGVALHGMPPEEWGFGGEDAELELLDEDELTELLGHEPSAQEVDRYLREAQLQSEGPDAQDVIDWALEMPDR